MIALLALLGSEPALSQSSSVSTAFCDKSRQTSAAEQDHMLRFAAAVRDALDASGSDTFIISRSGLDLSRFHIRYSHSAIMVRSDTGVWTARQLYYACDEGQPRIAAMQASMPDLCPVLSVDESARYIDEDDVDITISNRPLQQPGLLAFTGRIADRPLSFTGRTAGKCLLAQG